MHCLGSWAIIFLFTSHELSNSCQIRQIPRFLRQGLLSHCLLFARSVGGRCWVHRIDWFFRHPRSLHERPHQRESPRPRDRRIVGAGLRHRDLLNRKLVMPTNRRRRKDWKNFLPKRTSFLWSFVFARNFWVIFILCRLLKLFDWSDF